MAFLPFKDADAYPLHIQQAANRFNAPIEAFIRHTHVG